jgi:peptidoglycan/LPS O-acetylase OafA/YrhL
LLLSRKPTAAAPILARPQRRADIQGIRAVAVLLVVLFHAGLGPPGGFIGVDLFFVVSGFVITGLFRRQRAATGRVSLANFYLGRVRRLLPALAVVSFVTVIAGALFVSPLGATQNALGLSVATAGAFVANLFFFYRLGGYFQLTAASDAFLHTWTLSVEEQFYLGFPLLLLTGWHLSRRWRSRHWLTGLLVACLVLSLALELWLSFGQLSWVPMLGKIDAIRPGANVQLAFYLPLTRAWEFLAGALIAFAVSRWSPGPRLAAVLGLCGAVAVALGACCIQSTEPYPGLLAVVPVTAAVCLLLAGSGPMQPRGVTRLLSVRPAVVLGDLSYSWYLWHWPAIVITQAAFPGASWAGAAAGIGSLAPAALCYRLVERPIHRGQVFGSRRAIVAVGAVCLALPVAAGGALAEAAARSWDQPGLSAVQALIMPEHLDELAGCDLAVPLGSPARPSCTWTVAHPKGTILLVGDSNAGQFTEPVLEAARRLGYDLEVATYGGCPLQVRPRYFSASCQQFVQGTVAAIKARGTPFAAIVLSNASDGYVDGSQMTQFAGDAPAVAVGSVWQRAIAGWVQDDRRTLAALGHRSSVLVMGAIPQFPNLPICVWPSLLRGRTAGCGQLTSAEAVANRGRLIAAERPAVTAMGASYLSTGRLLCRPNGACSAFVHGTLVYRDVAHLSVSGSMLFEPDLQAALHRMTRHGLRRVAARRSG